MFIRFLSVFFVSSVLAYGEVTVEEYAAMIGNVHPEAHRISTLNHNGVAMCFTTELTQAFLEHCRKPDSQCVLEVGCAYGIKSSQIVQTGVSLVANDIEPRHLEKMKAAFDQLSQSDSHFRNVRYLQGNITTLDQEEIGNERYDAVLCESVIHFLYPEEVKTALAAMYRSLKFGGKIYLTVTSCHQRKKFQDIFLRNMAEGMEWPGVFEGLKGSQQPFHVFDVDILVRELKRAGFTPVICKYITKPFVPEKLQHDDRHWVIAIAEKQR